MKVLYTALVLIIITSVCVMSVNNAYAIGLEVRNKEGQLVYATPETNVKNLYEFGMWAFPIIITNLILFVFGVLYYKEWLPNKVKKTTVFILNFEISKKIAFIILASLITIFIIFNINQIWNPAEESWGDYKHVIPAVKNWSVLSGWNQILSFRYLLLSISYNILGNVRIIPFVISISLIILTYFITTELSKKRFAGIISVIILIQSNLFLKYSVSATKDNAWTFFYVLSLYLIYKKWFLSPLAYALALSSKSLVAIFLPMTFFSIYASSLSKKGKIKTALLYSITILAPATVIIYLYRGVNIDTSAFWIGFTSFESFMRSDGLISIFLIPLIIGLFLASKKGILHADTLMILIAGVLWSAPLLQSFTEITNQPYRFVPLVVFFAIGVSILFSNNVNRSLPVKKNHISSLVFLFTIITVLFSMAFVIFPKLITRI